MRNYMVSPVRGRSEGKAWQMFFNCPAPCHQGPSTTRAAPSANEPLWCLGLSHPRGNLNSMHFKCPIPTEAITVLESSVRDRPLRPRKRSQKWRTSSTRQGQSLFVFSNDTEREGRWGDDLKGQARVHRGETLTGKRADVIFEKTLGLAGLGHKTGECPLHVSSLGCGLLPQDLIVRHRLTVRLKGEQQRH